MERVRADRSCYARLAHNQQPVMCRIPPEILCAIFVETLPDSSSTSYPDVLLAVTHICRRWRHVAIDNPTLWIYPDMRRVILGDAMVQRSRSLPLHIRLNEQSVIGRPCSFSALARRTFPRMKIFECHVEKAETLEIVVHHLRKHSAPNLTSLTLQVLVYPFHPHPFISEPSPLSALGRNNPVDWGNSCFCKLTSLSLVLGGLPMSLAQLTTLIQQYPLLEHLILKDISFLDSRVLEKSATTIELPYLKALEIGGCSSHTLLLLLNRVTLPYTISVSAHFPDLPLGSLPSLCEICERICLGREIHHLECSMDNYDEGATVLKICGGSLTIATFEAITIGSIFRCVSSSAVGTITIDNYSLSEVLLRPYFQPSSNLQIVKIGNRSRLSFLELIDSLDHTPSIARVVLEAWQDFEDYPGDSEEAMPVYKDLLRLARIFRRRRYLLDGPPLQEIILEGFRVHNEREVSTMLSEVAQTILWHDLNLV
ncbi:hypothetical protein PM082_000583 [Marasmius tenuissimus]|nr:hypothetical protein PM082_000583 [Marasmius tenuissimus]